LVLTFVVPLVTVWRRCTPRMRLHTQGGTKWSTARIRSKSCHIWDRWQDLDRMWAVLHLVPPWVFKH